ncbi:hypothetical protein FRY98_03150 [Paenibacillus faecis]|uniref:Uncharacterized protein n=1 Tax=Paenibacillus faecis TaxID=862114 RepID=A0A5D0CZE4_9BACL|nr:hypothetical protein [Paenibacillus faecis]TYA14694.1 hypothetical protein FRY98_03150 [Paenibacillus faecis]
MVTKKNGSKEYCFDFGFLIESIEGIEDIFLYVPFPIKKEQIKDLGTIISNNQLVNAIFNENFTTTDGEPKRLTVNGTKDKPPFTIYSLEIESQIEISNCIRSGNTDKPGTILKIRIGNISPGSKARYYFRIRIQAQKKDIALINDQIKGISIFSNQFTNTEIIDFRLNDIRSCGEELREQFNKGLKFNLLAVHYLILRSADDLIIHYGESINSRMLENDLWKDYIDSVPTNNIIAYHIKKKANKTNSDNSGMPKYEYLEGFSDLTRFQYQKSSWLILLLYTIFIIIFGAAGGIFGDWISEIVQSLFRK